MKRNIFIYAILFVCSLIIISCSQDENLENRDNGKGQLIIHITDAGVYNGSNSRASTDIEYKTTFEDGDKIGLFAVKEGQIVGEIENICLTYMTEHKVWVPEGGTLSYSDELDGATYYAYYPYSREISNFEASANDPFATIANSWSIDSDLQNTQYTKNDLMTGKSTAELSGRNYALNLTLNHRMAMVVIELPSTTYTFTNTEPTLTKYSIPAINETFTLTKGAEAPIEVQPNKTATGQYRILINPNTAYKVNGTFSAGTKKKYEVSINGIEGGTYAPYTIDGGVKTIEHKLKVGDFYCADATLIDGTKAELTESEKGKIIGIVYYVGTTEAITADYSGCTHALVYALNRAERITIESDKYEYGEDKYIARWGVAQPVKNDNTWYGDHLKKDYDNIRGYEDTKYWLTVNYPDRDINGVMKACLNEYKINAPTCTTNWYVPSIKELRIIEDVQTTLGESLTKASGEALWNGATYDTSTKKGVGYWSSTFRAYNALLQNAGIVTATDIVGYSDIPGYFRFSLAF